MERRMERKGRRVRKAREGGKGIRKGEWNLGGVCGFMGIAPL